jgi:hypothetical protein
MHSPSRAIHLGVPQGLVNLPALFNHFISNISVPIPNIASYTDNLTIFVSSVEAELAMHLRTISDWSTEKKLSMALGKSSGMLFTPVMHQSQYHPSATICNGIIPRKKPAKS